MWIYLTALVIPMAATYALVAGTRFLCLRHRLFDEPGGRKIHQAPRPRLGGVGIYLGFAGTVLVGFAIAPWLASVPALRAVAPAAMAALGEAWSVKTPLFGLLMGGSLMFAVGLVDDLLGDRFPVGLKFAGQALAAGVAVGAGIQVEFAANEALNLILSFLWILGISNAFNLLDNMDGLAAGVAVISSALFLLNAAELSEIFIAFVLLALIGALFGFLRHNLHPASIFMGDAGALFIGFTLSSLTILEHYVSTASSSLFPVLMPPLVLAVPLVDTLSVTYIRLSEGRPVYRGDRCHLSHRLVACGLSQPQAVVFLYLVTLGIGLGALHLAHASPARSLFIILDSTLFAALLLWVIRFGQLFGFERFEALARDVASPDPANTREGK